MLQKGHTKICRYHVSAMQSQKAVSANFAGEQILPFDIAWKYSAVIEFVCMYDAGFLSDRIDSVSQGLIVQLCKSRSKL